MIFGSGRTFALYGRIILSSEILDKLLFDGANRPKLSPEFPAKYISTQLDWSNLVINNATLAEVETIRNWIAHNDDMVSEWGLKNKFKEENLLGEKMLR